jgi:hypothetical protein
VSWLDIALDLFPVPLILLANWADRPVPATQGPSARALRQIIWPLMAVLGVGSILFGVLILATPQAKARPDAIAQIVAGIACCLVVQRPVRAAIARLTPISADSSLDALAICLTVLIVGSQIGQQLSSNILASVASSSAIGPADLIANEVPFLIGAFLGVGIFMRRRPLETMRRLGLVRPSLWQVILGLASAGVFLGFVTGVDVLAVHFTPHLNQEVNQASGHLFSGLNSVSGILLIALSAGICEETLFRGALQPRVGILWTAIVFASVHTQYGLSLDALAVLVLAVGLGLLRKYCNTTTSMICHVAYNTLAGVALGGAAILPMVVVEVLLFGLLGGFWLRHRQEDQEGVGPLPG